MSQYQVLLFYKYTPINDPITFKTQQEQICQNLSLTGRLRVAKEGVNGNLGGTATNIAAYVQQLEINPAGNFSDVDFKISGVNVNAKEERTSEQQQMQGLTVKVTKELVSLGVGGSVDQMQHPGGQHVSPEEFHSMLTTKGIKEDVVLLDTRNIYETRIGQFEAPGVVTIDPETRQFSDLPRRLQDPQLTDRLKGRKILMYCTGGVRCERASALIQSHGEGFDQVYQLSGGIHRYVEKYGAKGMFKGKNFVFDDRMATPADDQVCGKCSVCNVPFDDYTIGCRCSRCRLRMLVCTTCNAAQPDAHHVCELCTVHANEERQDFGLSNVNLPRKVTHVGNIVCFHDVSGSTKSCASALRRIASKLQHYAEFRYVESKLCLDEYVNEKGDIVTSTKERPRLTWFGDDTVGATGATGASDSTGATTSTTSTTTKRRKKYTTNECLLNLLDVVVDAWPFDGMLGIGEGAGAASVVAMVMSMTNEVSTQFFDALTTSQDLTKRVERQRTCFQSIRESKGGRLMYTILINGRMAMNEDTLRLLKVMPYSESIVPSLHLNVRTRQHRIVGDLTAPLAAFEQEKGVHQLHQFFQKNSAPTTLVTPDDSGSNTSQTSSTSSDGNREKKRRKLEDGKSLPTDIKMHVYDAQPGVSIRNFACIEAMRSFLLRCSLHKK